MPRWFSANTSIMVGNPRQQRSHEVLPAAPMAKSASAISSAILLAPTNTQQGYGALSAKACTAAVCGAVLPITTVMLQAAGRLPESACSTAKVWLSLSTPPKFTKICFR